MSILNVSGDNSMLAFANFSIFDAVFENLHIQNLRRKFSDVID